mgnify:CR=1 FL=1
MIIIGLVGWKDSGKTFLAQKIITKLALLNYRVASIKHAHHEFDIDKPNTDSFLHRKAGSQQVIISSSKKWAKITELKDQKEKTLDELIDQLENIDIVIVEGFKKENHNKLEIINKFDHELGFIFKKIKNVVGIVSDIQINSFKKKQFKKNQIDEIVKFIINLKNE